MPRKILLGSTYKATNHRLISDFAADARLKLGTDARHQNRLARLQHQSQGTTELEDILALVTELPDRAFMANCFAGLREPIREALAPRRPKRPRHRASVAPRIWHQGRRRAA